MLLILTGQADGTVDMVVEKLQKPFFRFNLDDSESYDFSIGFSGWFIRNPTGFTISSDIATSCVWWKVPYHSGIADPYKRAEVREVARELYSWFESRAAIRGNSPLLELQWGKIRQSRLAQRYFQVADSVIVGGSAVSALDHSHTWVAKSLSSQPISSTTAMFTTSVVPDELDPAYPWLLQHKVQADHDVTVLVVDGTCFAWCRDRSTLSGLDWRQEQFTNTTPWVAYVLTQEEEAAIQGFCREMGVNWGRLDFLLSNGTLVFLEINPNGQWAFLDPLNERGTVSAVSHYFEN